MFLKKKNKKIEENIAKNVKKSVKEEKQEPVKGKTTKNEIKELLIPIGIHEAKSAYYKLKLVKVVASKSINAIKKKNEEYKEKKTIKKEKQK